VLQFSARRNYVRPNRLGGIYIPSLMRLRSSFLRFALPLLLAVLVLLTQTLALAHRSAHPNSGQRAAIAALVSGSALDLLFGHGSGSACDSFDAATGHDINPGHYAPAVIATSYSNGAPLASLAALFAAHPAGLFRARAPPQA
jgi:hypothetical protein